MSIVAALSEMSGKRLITAAGLVGSGCADAWNAAQERKSPFSSFSFVSKFRECSIHLSSTLLALFR